MKARHVKRNNLKINKNCLGWQFICVRFPKSCITVTCIAMYCRHILMDAVIPNHIRLNAFSEEKNLPNVSFENVSNHLNRNCKGDNSYDQKRLSLTDRHLFFFLSSFLLLLFLFLIADPACWPFTSQQQHHIVTPL